MKLTPRQMAIKAELERLDRWQELYYRPACDYFFKCMQAPSKRQNRLLREFWAIEKGKTAK